MVKMAENDIGNVRIEKAKEKAKTQIFPKEGKTRLSKDTAKKQGVP